MSEIIKWLRTLCMDCILAPQNRNADPPVPCCTECSNKHVVADEIERLQREIGDANSRFAQMNTPTGREIELTHELSETEKQLTIQRHYRKLADVENQRLRAKLASERFCRETFEGIANAYTVRCARCGTGHVFPADVSPELYFSVLACHNGLAVFEVSDKQTQINYGWLENENALLRDP